MAVYLLSRRTQDHFHHVLTELVRDGSGSKSTDMQVLDSLIKPNWPPWFAKSFNTRTLEGIRTLFPEGQITVSKDGDPIAALNTNRINWDGNVHNLLTWDRMIGTFHDFAGSYRPMGNTMVMLNINVAEGHRGENLPHAIIDIVVKYAQSEGIEKVIGLFRPNGYGMHKLESFKSTGTYPGFEEYVNMRNQQGRRLDPWLRNLSRNGMRLAGISADTTQVAVTIGEMDAYISTYNPEKWTQVAPNVWECGENGTWRAIPERKTAVYTESRVIGTVWRRG